MTRSGADAPTGAITTMKQPVDAAGVAAFHHAFGGSNAIHVDVEAAKALGGLVQHGMRTLFPVFAMLSSARNRGQAVTLKIEAKFLAPVKAGESLEAAIAQVERGAGGQAYEILATNEAGAKVMAGTATVTPR